ncbi:MAG: hypothetical protein NC918_00730 [Candidatus Omnitrophica bacterium]|nr:hypothetical protein [Candidatus Omnitrophota bacterium]
MGFEVVRILIALAIATISAYFDIFNKKNVPDWLLYSSLIISFLLNLVDTSMLFFSLIIGLAVFAIFYVLYRVGQVGGADGYILSAIAMALPYQPKSFLIFDGFFVLPFIFNVFVFASISFIIYVFISTFKLVIKNFKIQKANAINALIICLAYLLFLFFIFQNPFVFSIVGPGYVIVLSFLMFILGYYTLFKDIINQSMFEFVTIKEVEPEDIIAIDKMDKDIVKKYSLSRLVTKEQYQRMKAIKGKKIALYRHLPPFLPHVLIGLISAIFFGDLLNIIVNVF